ncbi:MAG: hypothetical protein AAGH15_13660 [Myxococcota bacterium]
MSTPVSVWAKRGVVLGLLLVACDLLTGCAGRAAQVHLRTAQGAHAALEVAADAIEGICTTERAQREGDGFVLRCHRATEAQHLAVEAHTQWTLAAGTEGLDGPAVAVHLATLVELYRELQAFLGLYDRDLPEVF